MGRAFVCLSARQAFWTRERPGLTMGFATNREKRVVAKSECRRRPWSAALLLGAVTVAVACRTGSSIPKLDQLNPAPRTREASADPFVGNYLLVGDSMGIGPRGVYRHARLHIERQDDWVTRTITFFGDTGPERTFAYRMREDGEDYAGLGDNPNSMASERTAPRSVRMVEKHNGHPATRYEEVLSGDGQILTASLTMLVEATGATPGIHLEVFRRLP